MEGAKNRFVKIDDSGDLLPAVADAGFLEGGFCYSVARKKILEAIPTFN